MPKWPSRLNKHKIDKKSQSINRAILIGFSAGLAALSGNISKADDYGCQVLLCLSNPGGPTEYSACVPPIERLWSDLRHFRGFPTCSGVGYSATSPIYDPYYCEAPATLIVGPTMDHGSSRYSNGQSRMSFGEEAVCQTRLPEPVCEYSAHERNCEIYQYSAPYVREKPHRIDLTIEGRGVQRIWY